MSTCAECGRVSPEWVQFSAQHGKELCWHCLQEAISNGQGGGDPTEEAPPSREPDPAPELPSLDGCLQQAETFLRRFVVLTDDQACGIVLWVAHTHVIDAAVVTAYLSVTSPEKRSGKTRLLEVLRLLVANPWLTGGTTKAALVRKMHKDHPTLLLDESDAAFNGDAEYSEALRGVLNNGFSRGKPYTTCVGNSHEVKDFDVFGAKAVAGIGKLPDTVEDRSIPIGLKRRTRSETVERFRERLARPGGEAISDGMAAALQDLTEELKHAEPDLPGELTDRGWDIWEPLLAIADTAGGEWPSRAREAAVSLSGNQDPDDDTLGTRLLTDIRAIYEQKDAEKLWTSEILEALNALEESPWGGWSDGKGIKARELSNKLHPYEIKSRTVRIGEDTHKGYFAKQFKDAWSRYVPEEGEKGSDPVPDGTSNVTPVTLALQSQKQGVFQASQDPDVTDRKRASNPHSNADVTDVTDRSPERTETDAFDGYLDEDFEAPRAGFQRLTEEEYVALHREREARERADG